MNQPGKCCRVGQFIFMIRLVHLVAQWAAVPAVRCLALRNRSGHPTIECTPFIYTSRGAK